jgi:hypothetical protein
MSIQYRDDEGDWIQLTDDMDILHAMHLSSVLCVRIFDEHVLPAPIYANTILNNSESILTKINESISVLSNLKLLLTSKKDTTIESERKSPCTTEKAPETSNITPLSLSDMAQFLDSVSVGERTSETAPQKANHGRSVEDNSQYRDISKSDQMSGTPEQPVYYTPTANIQQSMPHSGYQGYHPGPGYHDSTQPTQRPFVQYTPPQQRGIHINTQFMTPPTHPVASASYSPNAPPQSGPNSAEPISHTPQPLALPPQLSKSLQMPNKMNK